MTMRGRDLTEWRKRNCFSQEQLRQELRLASRQTLNSWELPEKEVPPLVERALYKLEQDLNFRQRM
jgi:transcriptional regulator with XRE-family HTH domain